MEILERLLSLRDRSVSGPVVEEERRPSTRVDEAGGVIIETGMGEFYITGCNGVFLLDPSGSEGSIVRHPETIAWATGLADTARRGQ